MTDNVAKEIREIIEIPTVLVRKDDLPPEYKDSKKYRKIKKRNIPCISPNLMHYLLTHKADFSSVERFSSGDFESFLSMNNAYYWWDI